MPHAPSCSERVEWPRFIALHACARAAVPFKGCRGAQRQRVRDSELCRSRRLINVLKHTLKGLDSRL